MAPAKKSGMATRSEIEKLLKNYELIADVMNMMTLINLIKICRISYRASTPYFNCFVLWPGNSITRRIN